MEIQVLASIMASALGLALTIYGVFYNTRATRALIEAIRQDVKAVQETTCAVREVTQAIHETFRTIQEDHLRRHRELLIQEDEPPASG